MTRRQPPQRGTQTWTCPVCGTEARVTQTGRLMKHKVETSDGQGGDWCPNKSPWPADTARGGGSWITDSSPWH